MRSGELREVAVAWRRTFTQAPNGEMVESGREEVVTLRVAQKKNDIDRQVLLDGGFDMGFVTLYTRFHPDIDTDVLLTYKGKDYEVKDITYHGHRQGMYLICRRPDK